MTLRYDKKLMALCLVLFVSCLGCGSGSDVGRATLSGKVTFGGKPIPYGLIYFSPDINRGNQGPQGYAEIINGEYRTDKVGIGAVTGPLVVRISGFPKGKDKDGMIQGNPLFPQYQTQIELEEGTKTMDFDVPAGQRM